jgi:UDP-N-acetylenolpyruvoylglucosamine reductase
LIGAMLDEFVGCIWGMGLVLYPYGIGRYGWRHSRWSQISRKIISVVMSRYVKVKITKPSAQVVATVNSLPQTRDANSQVTIGGCGSCPRSPNNTNRHQGKTGGKPEDHLGMFISTIGTFSRTLEHAPVAVCKSLDLVQLTAYNRSTPADSEQRWCRRS